MLFIPTNFFTGCFFFIKYVCISINQCDHKRASSNIISMPKKLDVKNQKQYKSIRKKRTSTFKCETARNPQREKLKCSRKNFNLIKTNPELFQLLCHLEEGGMDLTWRPARPRRGRKRLCDSALSCSRSIPASPSARCLHPWPSSYLWPSPMAGGPSQHNAGFTLLGYCSDRFPHSSLVRTSRPAHVSPAHRNVYPICLAVESWAVDLMINLCGHNICFYCRNGGTGGKSQKLVWRFFR